MDSWVEAATFKQIISSYFTIPRLLWQVKIYPGYLVERKVSLLCLVTLSDIAADRVVRWLVFPLNNATLLIYKNLNGFIGPVPVGLNCCPTVTFNQRVQGDDQPSVKKSNDPIVMEQFFVKEREKQEQRKTFNENLKSFVWRLKLMK